MAADAGVWNSLEAVKLVVGVLTPISVAGFGWFISRRLKRFELLQWSNQKLIEKRIAVYDLVGPQINKLYCFFMWVGTWKETSPVEVLQIKRDLDRTMHVYGHLFDHSVFSAYREFIDTLFDTFQGVGADAKIRSFLSSLDGDRTNHCAYEWQPAWEEKFASPERAPSLHEIETRHTTLLKAFAQSMGVRE